MDSSELPVIIFMGIIGVITLIVIVSVVFGRVLDRRGIKNSKKMGPGDGGSDSVYLS